MTVRFWLPCRFTAVLAARPMLRPPLLLERLVAELTAPLLTPNDPMAPSTLLVMVAVAELEVEEVELVVDEPELVEEVSDEVEEVDEVDEVEVLESSSDDVVVVVAADVVALVTIRWSSVTEPDAKVAVWLACVLPT
jgi:hypothetical protein